MIEYIKQKLIRFITYYLPRHGKRMLYIVTCYLAWSKTKDEQRIRHDLIEINNRLKLSKDEHALRFAIELRHILSEVDEIQSLMSEPVETLKPKSIIERIPEWLRYELDNNRVTNELSYVFKPRYQHGLTM